MLTIAARRADSTPSSSLRVAPVEGLGHGEADHRVPEELQPLVVTPGGVGMLVEPAAVDERLREQVAIADGEPEALRQRVGWVHDPGLGG